MSPRYELEWLLGRLVTFLPFTLVAFAWGDSSQQRAPSRSPAYFAASIAASVGSVLFVVHLYGWTTNRIDFGNGWSISMEVPPEWLSPLAFAGVIAVWIAILLSFLTPPRRRWWLIAVCGYMLTHLVHSPAGTGDVTLAWIFLLSPLVLATLVWFPVSLNGLPKCSRPAFAALCIVTFALAAITLTIIRRLYWIHALPPALNPVWVSDREATTVVWWQVIPLLLGESQPLSISLSLVAALGAGLGWYSLRRDQTRFPRVVTFLSVWAMVIPFTLSLFVGARYLYTLLLALACLYLYLDRPSELTRCSRGAES